MFVKKKVKNRKRNTYEQKETMDTIHTNTVQNFVEEKKNCTERLSKANTPTKKRELKAELKSIQERENQYYLDTGHLLFDYYDKQNNCGKESVYNNIREGDVMSFFQKNAENPNKNNNINLNQIIQQYEKVTKKQQQVVIERENIEWCKDCRKDKILTNHGSVLLCPSCGKEEEILMIQDKPSYKEPPKEHNYFAYKRLNHLNEWLSQFQAKESTFIPVEIIEKLKNECKKERIANIKKIRASKIRSYLKKLGLTKYYEHIPHIMTKITGVPPPIIPREQEEILRNMFMQIQIPFNRHCPKKRKNFLSYSYVLHKMTQLLGMDELTTCFPLLKSRTKLYQQDKIWKDICGDLRWEFIKSV